MKKNKKYLLNIVFFILLIVLTFYILLKDQNILDIFNLMLNSNKTFILIAIFCMFVYLLLEAVNMLRTIRISGNKHIKLSSALKYAFIGFFFSAVTPAASGGQPMQIYYMHRDKIPVADSTLALLMNLFSFQIIILYYIFHTCRILTLLDVLISSLLIFLHDRTIICLISFPAQTVLILSVI